MKRLATCSILCSSLISLCEGDDLSSLKFFETHVRPLLSAECYECHGAEKAKAGLRLDHLDFILKGGDTGPALVRHDPGKSLLIEAVRRTDPDFSMPPKTTLTDQQIATLEQWISMGAPWPEEKVTEVERDEHGFTNEDREWWAIQPLAKVSPPVENDGWAKNGIDQFISRKLKENHLKPSPAATPEELVRRLYFDLHGLPPSAAQSSAFVNAYRANPDEAVANTVDELLDSPHYGERWGQHWLDVVRYAESDGYRADGYRAETWRYRDYVIRSFNEDKPYDQFVREQLAADELTPGDPDSLIATAFLRLGIYEWNQRNAEMQWDLILTEMTNVTSEAFLGLGMGCAQCHDHKFDPILQKDYFALQAFLNSTWWPESEPFASPQEKADYERKEASWRKAAAPVLKKLEALTAERKARSIDFVVGQFPEEVQEIYRTPAGERTAYEEQIAQLVQRQVDHGERRLDFEKDFSKDKAKLAKYQKLKAELAELDTLKPAPLPAAFVTTDVGPDPAQTFFKKRGEKVTVEPAFLTLLDPETPEITPTANTTGRRTALANWITDEANPFSTRVIVNRIWQRHFGRGLVATPNDFGRLGDPPSHPELLDWLTGEFLEQGWQLKPLHRLITTSATYRQTARREPMTEESTTDPENRLLWRFTPRRLDAEEIRDAGLAISGELDRHTGGPSVDGKIPRRSVYVKKRRNTRDPMIGGFDAPSGFSSAPTRLTTTTPNQSLMLVNSEWPMARAESFAKNLLAGKAKADQKMIRQSFEAVFGRLPESGEITQALAFIEKQQEVVESSIAEPVYKYPNETGLRPVSQQFSGIAPVETGDQSLWLQPGSRFEKLEIHQVDWPEDSFTIEAVARLDRIQKDASVNTLASRWNGSQEDTGWSFGVTSEKSRYDPRNFIVQLTGDDFQHNRIYEVVASNLRFPLNKPVYFAAAISAHPCDNGGTAGKVTFYLKDLSDPASPLQTETVSHGIVGGLQTADQVKALLGGRDQKGHLWDGQLARFSVSKGPLTKEQLLISKRPRSGRLIDLQFGSEAGHPPAPGTAWVRRPQAKRADTSSKQLSALTDYCHALLSSNEFLYLH
ncbi:MAG: PSD1 and planctomycete cytochrome C domain-containing protein [Verrucomicrobiales bacterium]|nr:PSD1 and planctomycete cytochrome C domain-containing protein [Verrucomicrobiales bacterium]